MSLFEDDENLVCTTDPHVTQGVQEEQRDAQAFAGELQQQMYHHELQGTTTSAAQHELDLRAAISSADARRAQQVAADTDRRQVVPAQGPNSSRRNTPGASTPATSRLSNASGKTVFTLEEENKSLMIQLRSQERAVAQMSQESEKQAKLIQSLTNRIEREAQERRELEQKLRLQETQFAALRKENVLLQRQTQSSSGGGAGDTETRLNRALQEIERLRSRMPPSSAGTPSEATNSASLTGTESVELTQVRSENKKLELQRTELINCVRKQNKLIDILKKQKIHLEAAKLLQITEEEFTKVLEINHK